MAWANEVTRIDRWLFGRLTANATIIAQVGSKVYADHAPIGVDAPYVIYQMQSGIDKRTATSGSRIYLDTLWVVKVVVSGQSYIPGEATADAIDDLLNESFDSTSIPGYVVLFSRREEVFRLSEIPQSGQPYRHLGGVYNIAIQKVS